MKNTSIVTSSTSATSSNNSPVVTMSSLEIVDYINSQRKAGEAELRHDHFMAKVLVVLGEIDAPKFRAIYKDSMNRDKPCYNFPKRESCLMAMSYSYELQAQIFDKMTELELAVSQPKAPSLPSTYIEALEYLVASEKEKVALTQQLTLAAPKIAFAEAVESSEDLILVRDLAKLICGNGVDMGEKRLFAWLREHNFLMRDNSPYQSAMERGLFKVTESVYHQGNQTKITKTTKVTGKGQSYFLSKFL